MAENKVRLSDFYKPKPKQLEAHKNRTAYKLYGGAMGGGKSYWLSAEALKNCLKFSGNRCVIIRKELRVMKRTIWITFQQICPPGLIKKINRQQMTIDFINGSHLMFLEANVSRDPLFNKLKGLEIGWFGIDEANEVDENAYIILRTRLRWVLPKDTREGEYHRKDRNGNKLPRYEGALTSNPEICWVKNRFIKSPGDDETYIKALTTDNYDEDSEYVKNLKEAFKGNPDLLKKYLEANWDVATAINQLISVEAIAKAGKEIEVPEGTPVTLSMGVDVARYGGDRSIIIILKNGNVAHMEEYKDTSTTELGNRVAVLMEEWGIPESHVGIDVVGLGAGTIDKLKEIGYSVVELAGGASPNHDIDVGTFRPLNLRSQMYLKLKQDCEEGNIGNISDDQLIDELNAIRYVIQSNRTIKILEKEQIKKQLSVSPDKADALAYANWVKEGIVDTGIFYMS